MAELDMGWVTEYLHVEAEEENTRTFDGFDI